MWERNKEKQKEYYKKFCLAHPEKQKEYSKRHYQKHREEILIKKKIKRCAKE